MGCATVVPRTETELISAGELTGVWSGVAVVRSLGDCEFKPKKRALQFHLSSERANEFSMLVPGLQSTREAPQWEGRVLPDGTVRAKRSTTATCNGETRPHEVNYDGLFSRKREKLRIQLEGTSNVCPELNCVFLVNFDFRKTLVGTRQVEKPEESAAAIPETVDEAVELLRTEWLSPESLEWILHNPRDRVLGFLHMPFGTGVRNAWRLWGPPTPLHESCGTTHAEGCSGVIFERLWEAIRADAQPSLVEALDCQFELLDSLQIEHREFWQLRLGEVLTSMQQQIDRQLANLADSEGHVCQEQLRLRPVGEFDRDCWTRADFWDEGSYRAGSVVGWVAVKNGFEPHHSPPEIELRFHKACAWPERPSEVFFRPWWVGEEPGDTGAEPSPGSSPPVAMSPNKPMRVEPKNKYSVGPRGVTPAGTVFYAKVLTKADNIALRLHLCGEPCTTAETVRVWWPRTYAAGNELSERVEVEGKYYLWAEDVTKNGEASVDRAASDDIRGDKLRIIFESGTVIDAWYVVP